MPARIHRFYPTNPASLPRNINRNSVRQGQSPPVSAAGIGWILGSSPLEANHLGQSPRSSHTLGTSPRSGRSVAGTSPSSSSLPLPHFQHPSYELLDRNGFQQMKYDRWKQRCLDDRAHTGTIYLGFSREMCSWITRLKSQTIIPVLKANLGKVSCAEGTNYATFPVIENSICLSRLASLSGQERLRALYRNWAER